MKKFLCFFMVALLSALLVVPCFAAESTASPSDPVDWFGGETQVLVSYSVTVDSRIEQGTTSYSIFCAWLRACGATSSDDSIGSFSGHNTSSGNYSNRPLWSDGTVVKNVSGTWDWVQSGTYTSSSTDGYNLAITIPEISVSPVYEIVPGGGGFVDTGVSDALTELSIIVSAILSNQYILIAIGLAVAVPLVAWGISKIKSLVKGY